MREKPAWKRNSPRICAQSDRLRKKSLSAEKCYEAKQYAIF